WARARRYAYRLLDHEDLLLGRYAWRPRHGFEAGCLARATAPLEGPHDFSSFRSAGSAEGPPCCRVMRAAWRRWECGLQLDILADRFLYHMVRAVVGTALAVCREADPAAAMRAILGARDRARAAENAPAQGLCLEQVFYEAEAPAR